MKGFFVNIWSIRENFHSQGQLNFSLINRPLTKNGRNYGVNLGVLKSILIRHSCPI